MAQTHGVFDVDYVTRELAELDPKKISSKIYQVNAEKNVFVHCHIGVRSQSAVNWLKNKGYKHAVNILGGIDAWSALIDNSRIYLGQFLDGERLLYLSLQPGQHGS